jgi:hypothetical protein
MTTSGRQDDFVWLQKVIVISCDKGQAISEGIDKMACVRAASE